MEKFAESDMYEPIKKFLTALGYEVRGEVKGCDLFAAKDGLALIVEMKKSFSLKLVFQAMERQKTTNQVYMAIPRPKNARAGEFRSARALAAKLELGLLTVAMDSPVKTVEFLCFPPAEEKSRNPLKKEIMLKEAAGRRFDLNRGGSSKKRLLTAYREKMIKLACALEKTGEARAADLVSLYGCDKYANSMLNRNLYGWFKKTGRGIFALSEAGKEALASGEFAEAVDYYRGGV